MLGRITAKSSFRAVASRTQTTYNVAGHHLRHNSSYPHHRCLASTVVAAAASTSSVGASGFAPRRSFSDGGGGESTDSSSSSLVYEGPLASLTLRLKRVSVSTCALGLVGLPAMSLLYGVGLDASSTTAQVAVGGTAVVAACGSTVALSYCFSPYVHTLERVTSSSTRLRAVTRNVLARRVVTEFDPATDVTNDGTGHRPFCNFVAKGVPMYVHGEVIVDETLYRQLLGRTKEEEEERLRTATAANKKDDDDTFL